MVSPTVTIVIEKFLFNCTVRVVVLPEYTCGQVMHNANKMMIDDKSFFIIQRDIIVSSKL